MNTDGTGLKAALQTKGMTYGDLARKLGVTSGAVDHWAECRNRPAPHRKAAIESILGPLPGLEAGCDRGANQHKKTKPSVPKPAVEKLQPASPSTPVDALRDELRTLEAKLAETEPLRQRADRIRQAIAILES